MIVRCIWSMLEVCKQCTFSWTLVQSNPTLLRGSLEVYYVEWWQLIMNFVLSTSFMCYYSLQLIHQSFSFSFSKKVFHLVFFPSWDLVLQFSDWKWFQIQKNIMEFIYSKEYKKKKKKSCKIHFYSENWMGKWGRYRSSSDFLLNTKCSLFLAK